VLAYLQLVVLILSWVPYGCCVILEASSGTTWRWQGSADPVGSSCVWWDYVETSSMGQMSVDSEVYNDWCLPHIYDDCSPTSNARGSNLLFGCVSAATVLKNAFVLVQVNRFQQIIGVYTLQAPSYGNKVGTVWTAIRSDIVYFNHTGAWRTSRLKYFLTTTQF